jgi:hypothetical protein
MKKLLLDTSLGVLSGSALARDKLAYDETGYRSQR